jgi:beta-fructofuranosidase
MRKHGVAVNDLHALTSGFASDLFTAPGNVHFTKEGYQRIAQQVAEQISSVGRLPASESSQQIRVECGDFVKIYDPSVGENESWYINDHCFVHGDDGRWHLFGITHEEPANPLNEIHFAHATAGTLLQQPWDKQPFALSVAKQPPWNEVHLWAPHVIQHEGTYYMYYCAGDRDHTQYKIHLATSPDLKSWTRHPQNPMVVDGFDARDPFILRVQDKWVMYYTANSRPERGNHIVAYVTSDDLLNWGQRGVACIDPKVGTYGGPTESPFVVQRGKRYYLFIGPRQGYDGTDVFVSEDPLHWELENKVGHFPAHAAEIMRDQRGNWYISRCGWGRGGVYLAPLIWKDGQQDPETNIPVPD